MTMMTKTRDMLEGLVRDGSFKWVLGNRSSLEEEYDEMGRSPSGKRKWMPELSQIANVVVGRCSRILDVPMDELKLDFDAHASESVKHPSQYARNFLEYCCFRTLALSSLIKGHLADKHFRRLSFDMMLAWESPAVPSESPNKVKMESAVGRDAFCRIAPAIPAVADVVTSDDLFDVLTFSASGHLSFPVYEKYLGGLEKAIKKLKSHSESSLLSGNRLPRSEKILEVDGTVTTQPVLQHVGMSTWPGRLVLTDYALYFEPVKVVSYDKATVYDLSEDLRQVVKPELTGPWGTRLFDKAVMYKSNCIPEPVVMEFPELTGHSRRDYWLSIICEILYAHQFIRKFEIKGVEKDEALSKAVLSILRLQAIQEMSQMTSFRCEALLLFSRAEELPGGDLILETLASILAPREMKKLINVGSQSRVYSVSALSILSNLGLSLGSNPKSLHEAGLLVGELVVGEISPLEKAVKDSRSSFKNVELARATVDGVKVEGIDTNLAVMKELLVPVSTLWKTLQFIASWNDPVKSLVFCFIVTLIIYRGWIGYALGVVHIFFAIFLLLTRFFSQGRPVAEMKVSAPPPMNTVEQLLAVQNAISKVEEFVQDGNVVLLKLRALMLAVFPQATEKIALALVVVALMFAFIPAKYIVIVVFLEAFTRNSPPRKNSTERWIRRLREWWFSIPAAPVVFEGAKEDKKKR